MKFLKPFLSILLIASIVTLSGCVKGTATNPGTGFNYKLLSQGSITSLTSLRDSFQALAVNDAKFQKDVDALNKILVIASPVNDAIQSGDNQTLVQRIEEFASLGANISATLGLSPDIVIAINLGIGVFKSIEPFISGSGSTISTSGVTAAADVQADPRVKLGQLQAVDATYKKKAGRQ